MNIALTPEQKAALSRGERVEITVGDEECVLVQREVFQRLTYDDSPWTPEEMQAMAEHMFESADNAEPFHEEG